MPGGSPRTLFGISCQRQEVCGNTAKNFVKILDNQMDWEYRAGELKATAARRLNLALRLPRNPTPVKSLRFSRQHSRVMKSFTIVRRKNFFGFGLRLHRYRVAHSVPQANV
jgi:hypothetical protein